MSTTERPRSTRVLFRAVSWTGLAFLMSGTIGSVWSLLTFVQVRTGWGVSEFERCCEDLEKASLGGMLASMFFVLIGSGVVLLLHPIRAHLARESGKPVPRWLRWMAIGLVVYAVGVIVLATVLAGMAEDLEGFAAGIVTYCMLVGVGMLTAAWGFKRASEAD
jgi:predicted membrane channel-forming protein YqfA (hemolysin III family)